jgi:hypothetical protein
MAVRWGKKLKPIDRWRSDARKAQTAPALVVPPPNNTRRTPNLVVRNWQCKRQDRSAFCALTYHAGHRFRARSPAESSRPNPPLTQTPAGPLSQPPRPQCRGQPVCKRPHKTKIKNKRKGARPLTKVHVCVGVIRRIANKRASDSRALTSTWSCKGRDLGIYTIIYILII